MEDKMKNRREVESIIAPPAPHMVGDGFRVHGFIPAVPQLSMRRMDPFLVLDYNSKFEFPPSPMPRGVGVHPHKGFETVTIAYKGSVAHKDSSGGGGIINEGDVQWMTAGNGVLHKEFHEEEFSKKGGEFQMVQLWVNLPAKFKTTPAKYQAIFNKEIHRHQLDDNRGSVEVVAGEFEGTKGSASTFTPVHLYNVRLNQGKQIKLDFPEGYTTFMIVIEGGITVNEDAEAPLNHFVLMDSKGEYFTIQANEDSLVLVVSGEPIREPIASYGPFVMNTEHELVEAFNDFNLGKFGYLE